MFFFKNKKTETDPNTAKNIEDGADLPQQAGTSPERKHCTPEERMERIGQGVTVLNDHLRLDRASICLPGDFRWAVAEESRACVTCPGCADLKTGKACSMADEGHSEHSIMKTVEHSSSKNIPFNVTDRASWEKIQNVVHFMIHHPNRASQKWYEETIKSLGHTSILDKEIRMGLSEEQQKRLVQTLFSEISAVVLSSHAIFATYTAMGKPVPPLPTITEDDMKEKQVPPTFEDIVTMGMLKPGRTFREANPKYCDTPYAVIKDVNKNSEAFLNLSKEHQQYLSASMNIPHPMCMLSLAPESMCLAADVAAYICMDEVAVGAPWSKLDPSNYCVENPTPSEAGECFSRLDCESINFTVAEEYKATFCEEYHRAVILGLIAGEKSEREVMLILFAQTAIQKPQDPAALQQVMDRVQEEYGEAALVEGAASIGYSELVSRAARLANARPLPKGVYYMLPKVIRLMKRFSA